MFTYVADARPHGNVNIRRVCSNCGGVFCVSYGAQNYRRPPLQLEAGLTTARRNRHDHVERFRQLHRSDLQV